MTLALVQLEFKILDKILFYNDSAKDDLKFQEEDIDYTIDCILHAFNSLKDLELLRELYIKLALVPILKRGIDIKYGEGQRFVSYRALIKLHSIMPATMETVLDYFPYIGSWRDLKSIYGLVYNGKTYCHKNRLLSRIIDIWVFHLHNEELKLNNNRRDFSLLCKWIPKQGSALNRDTKVVNAIVKRLYPEAYKKNRFNAFKKYRKLVSNINKQLQTTEVLMCSKNFHMIDFEHVPKSCMNKYKRAWLDTNKGSSKRRHPCLLDRSLTRNNYIDHIHRVYKDHVIKPTIRFKISNKYTDRHILSKLGSSSFNSFRESIIGIGEINYMAYNTQARVNI